MRVLGGKSLRCDCIAMKSLSLWSSFGLMAYLQQPPKTRERVATQSDI